MNAWATLILSLVVTMNPAIGVSSSRQMQILFLGDSLTEGYNLAKEEAYPYLIEERLKREGQSPVCLNAGISGSTSASAISRMRWHLKKKPDILVLALGANDGLRGLPPSQTKKNLNDVLVLARENKIKVLLLGMKMPPNYGKGFTEEFNKVFPDLAKEHKVAFVPFLLENVAGKKNLNLADGIHPNAEGHKMIAETVYKALKPLL